jgi:REP element-mobilizing transposase RayT
VAEDAVPSQGAGAPPVQSERVTRRHLPHWQRAGAIYALTGRCRAGITLSEAERDLVLAAIHHWDAIRWDVLVAVVMPDHVHLLACPLAKGAGRWDLGELLHSVKSFSAHQIARRRNPAPARPPEPVGPASRRPSSSSSIWQDERYDRWMRDEEELERTWAYIVENPVRAGLVEQAESYRWLYQSSEAGG